MYAQVHVVRSSSISRLLKLKIADCRFRQDLQDSLSHPHTNPHPPTCPPTHKHKGLWGQWNVISGHRAPKTYAHPMSTWKFELQFASGSRVTTNKSFSVLNTFLICFSHEKIVCLCLAFISQSILKGHAGSYRAKFWRSKRNTTNLLTCFMEALIVYGAKFWSRKTNTTNPFTCFTEAHIVYDVS